MKYGENLIKGKHFGKISDVRGYRMFWRKNRPNLFFDLSISRFFKYSSFTEIAENAVMETVLRFFADWHIYCSNSFVNNLQNVKQN